jgi:carbamoyl-phosphate synthase large subunit
VAVKEAVFPWARFAGVDVILGPEMKSTGEVMGVAMDLPTAFAKSQLAAGIRLPERGRVFLSVRDEDKPALVDIARRLQRLGFTLLATGGTCRYLAGKGIEAEPVAKVTEGQPNIVDRIRAGEVALVLNTTSGSQDIADSFSIRRESLQQGVPTCTSVELASLLVQGLGTLDRSQRAVQPLQTFLADVPRQRSFLR